MEGRLGGAGVLTRAQGQRRPALPALTGLRVLAAVWVVLFHYREELEALLPWLAPADTFVRAGYLGVDLFFPLSGFVLAYNYADPMRTFSWTGAVGFVRNRFARVWPVHFVALNIDLLVALLTGNLGIGENGHRRTLEAYVENVFLVQNWWHDRPSFNGPAWSIGSEWFAYLLTPLLFVLLARLARGRTALLGAALSYAAMLGVFAALALPNGNLDHMFYVRIMGEFVGGALLCLAWVRGGVVLGWLSPVLVLVVAVVASAPGRWTRWLAAPAMVAAGEASYCLYMTHYLLQPVVVRLRDWGAGAWWAAGVATTGIVAVLGAAAWAMHVVVERPARRLLQSRLGRAPSRGRPDTVAAGHQHGPRPAMEERTPA